MGTCSKNLRGVRKEWRELGDESKGMGARERQRVQMRARGREQGEENVGWRARELNEGTKARGRVRGEESVGKRTRGWERGNESDGTRARERERGCRFLILPPFNNGKMHKIVRHFGMFSRWILGQGTYWTTKSGFSSFEKRVQISGRYLFELL